ARRRTVGGPTACRADASRRTDLRIDRFVGDPRSTAATAGGPGGHRRCRRLRGIAIVRIQRSTTAGPDPARPRWLTPRRAPDVWHSMSASGTANPNPGERERFLARLA